MKENTVIQNVEFVDRAPFAVQMYAHSSTYVHTYKVRQWIIDDVSQLRSKATCVGRRGHNWSSISFAIFHFYENKLRFFSGCT